MRLGIVTHNVVRGDGQGRVNFEIARAAARRGHHVTLLAHRVDSDLIESEPNIIWRPVKLAISRPNLLKVDAFARSAGPMYDELRPNIDLMIANGFVVRRPSDFNICHLVHAEWLACPMHTSRTTKPPYSWYQSMYSRLNRRWERITYHNAGHVVAVSLAVKDQLINRVGVDVDKISVICNGVDINEFRPRSIPRAQMGLSNDNRPIAVFIGDIRTPLKNLGTVLKAMQSLPQLHLAVVGGVDRSPYPAAAAALGLKDRVHFMGHRSDIPDILSASDFMIHPSRYDAFGLVVLEAMASGLPVIVAQSVGACVCVKQAGGWVIDDAEDVAALTAAMSDICSLDEVAYSEVSQRHRLVAEEYQWTDMADQYMDLFEGILN